MQVESCLITGQISEDVITKTDLGKNEALIRFNITRVSVHVHTLYIVF